MSPKDSQSGTQDKEALEALERFVVENDELLTLESLIGKFNIFDALRITHTEIRHSNFLAFLLDPSESHGQGQLFLKAVVMDLLNQAPSEKRPISPIVLDGADLRGVVVKREWKHIDVLIRCQEPAFLIAIENKILATEGPNQLTRYKKTIEQYYPTTRSLHVYLTLDAEEPSDDAWVAYGYENIHRVLKRVRNANNKAIGDEVLLFVDHYLNLIGSRLMNDDQITELCRTIYNNHRRALDLIWDTVGSPEASELTDVGDILNEDTRWEVVFPHKNAIDFVPKLWLSWLPPLGQSQSRPWIYVRIQVDNCRLCYAIEIAPMADSTKRFDIGTKLIEECARVGFKRSKPKGVKNTYGRLSGVEVILDWGEVDPPESDVIRAAVKNTLDDLFAKLEKLTPVLKALCNVSA
jgi:hypothetical protein